MVNKIFFNNLKINQSYTDSVKVTNTIIKKFASASGDKNPIHLNDKFAKNSILSLNKKALLFSFAVSTSRPDRSTFEDTIFKLLIFVS